MVLVNFLKCSLARDGCFCGMSERILRDAAFLCDVARRLFQRPAIVKIGPCEVNGVLSLSFSKLDISHAGGRHAHL
ncbi:hypothetical protein DES53_1292 [Roseimicrobium gellanilyticum]|uniref:Uncharacterized protein n=1 Tax=Roseimicrobium gellanilyticum TaxID=748857 RepID=A0A366H1I0_9BACT|nr:hypothetical protein DES53_1292 [Roseimicrobium gellanilyticum]